MSMKFGLPIDVDFRTSDIIKYETGSSITPPRLPSWKSISGHTIAAGIPIWLKFGNLMQNSTPITVIWSKSHGGRLFFSCGLRYVEKIWFAGRFLHSDESDIIKYETGSSIQPPLPPSCHCIWRYYSDACCPIWSKFRNL